jgi:hypothetical protein
MASAASPQQIGLPSFSSRNWPPPHSQARAAFFCAHHAVCGQRASTLGIGRATANPSCWRDWHGGVGEAGAVGIAVRIDWHHAARMVKPWFAAGLRTGAALPDRREGKWVSAPRLHLGNRPK